MSNFRRLRILVELKVAGFVGQCLVRMRFPRARAGSFLLPDCLLIDRDLGLPKLVLLIPPLFKRSIGTAAALRRARGGCDAAGELDVVCWTNSWAAGNVRNKTFAGSHGFQGVCRNCRYPVIKGVVGNRNTIRRRNGPDRCASRRRLGKGSGTDHAFLCRVGTDTQKLGAVPYARLEVMLLNNLLLFVKV